MRAITSTIEYRSAAFNEISVKIMMSSSKKFSKIALTVLGSKTSIMVTLDSCNGGLMLATYTFVIPVWNSNCLLDTVESTH